MNRLFPCAFAALVAVLLVSSCSVPDLGDVPFRCGSDSEGAKAICPRGYHCADGFCLRDGLTWADIIRPDEDRPSADAGDDQVVRGGELVQLRGSAVDPQSRPLTFEWTQIEGTTVELSDPGELEPTFVAPLRADLLSFSLVVRAGTIASNVDTVTVQVLSEPDPPVCGELPKGCFVADLRLATGDLASGDVAAGLEFLRAPRSAGIELVAVENGCVYVASMLADAERAELSQTFRVKASDKGRFLEAIEVGPLNWWPTDRPGPGDASLELTLRVDDLLIGTVSRLTSAIGGAAVRFDFSSFRVRLDSEAVYEMRLSTDLDVGSNYRIGWLAVGYDNPSCVDEHGQQRRADDPTTFLRYCSGSGDCGPSLNTDGVFRVEGAPRALVELAGTPPGWLAVSSIDMDVSGELLIDLEAEKGMGIWEPVVSASSPADLAKSDAVGVKLALTASFVGRPASLDCLMVCLADSGSTVTILSGPPQHTTESTATITFDCSEFFCDFECSLNEAPFASCSSPMTLDALDYGDHVMKIRAAPPGTGLFGEPATHEWTIIPL